MTPVIEHAGIEGTRPRVIRNGRVHRLGPGEVLDVSEDEAREHLDAGTVRLVDDADASVPTGDEQGVDKGEAVGTDADAPTPAADDVAKMDKAEVVKRLDELDAEYDGRAGVKKLREVLRAALAG